ncbi:histidine phosphatase family protein [Bacteroidota bacterium]
MIKSLLLIRHAQAKTKEPGEKDIDRSLNEAGVMESLRIGRYLSKEEVNIEQIMTSHARRAFETATLISESLKLDPNKITELEDLYEASARTLLDRINQFEESFCCVVLIGHNPALTFLGEYLSSQPIGFLPPGGLIWLAFEDMSWENVEKETAFLKGTIYPEQLTIS